MVMFDCSTTTNSNSKAMTFTDMDVSTLEAFAIFCGLGIHNTLIYEQALKLMAKQRVALEVLSYHASSSSEEASRLACSPPLDAHHVGLYRFDFCDFSLDDKDTCLAALQMFTELELNSKFKISNQVSW